MNVILRNSTRRMIDQSRASVEAEGFIAWLRTDGYTDGAPGYRATNTL